MSINRRFTKYVSQNIFGMIGISLYILADTFFISKAEGANGITALNLFLPMYSLISALGVMLGVGGATRFKLERTKGDQGAELYFSNAMIWAFVIGLVFMILGGLFPEKILMCLGGDEAIIETARNYARIIMMFAPFFMWNFICNAFVRNDGAPTIAMAATLISSVFNIVMDYVFMFPMKMGMPGAALATLMSPMVGISICCIHFYSKQNTIRFLWRIPSLKRFIMSCQLGVAAFIGEFASAVTMLVFNMVILNLTGNIGVAAYGIIANIALVAASVLNGIAQGSQPLLSEYYGKKDKVSVKKLLYKGIFTGLVMAVVMMVIMIVLANPIVGIFNSEHNTAMGQLAVAGIKIYFVGFVFASYNIVGIGFLSSVESARWSFVSSMTRGVIAIVICVLVLSMLFGMMGVWLAFPVAEFITAMLTTVAIICTFKERI